MAQDWPLAFTHFEISRSPADRSSKVTTVPGHGPTVARTPGNLCGRNPGGHTGVRAGQRGAAPPARQSRAARPRVHSHTDTGHRGTVTLPTMTMTTMLVYRELT